ncbi:hypothetical protein IBX65_09240 [Candidatus Aerophobetes bacterium]|nr:hypothetical protein [Candidatus Aerophobetes bacterium]
MVSWQAMEFCTIRYLKASMGQKNEKREMGTTRWEVNYYQRKTGGEIDFVLNKEKACEVKINPQPSDIKKLQEISANLHLKEYKIVGKIYFPSHRRTDVWIYAVTGYEFSFIAIYCQKIFFRLSLGYLCAAFTIILFLSIILTKNLDEEDVMILRVTQEKCARCSFEVSRILSWEDTFLKL